MTFSGLVSDSRGEMPWAECSQSPNMTASKQFPCTVLSFSSAPKFSVSDIFNVFGK